MKFTVDEYGLTLRDWCECPRGQELRASYEAKRAIKIEEGAECCPDCHTFGGSEPCVDRFGVDMYHKWCSCPIGERRRAAYEGEHDTARRAWQDQRALECFAAANVPKRYHQVTLASCIARNPVMGKQVKQWLEARPEGQGVLLWGSVGVGKTYMAVAIMAELIDQLVSEATFVVVPELLEQIRRSFDRKSGDGPSNPLGRLMSVPILVLDDISAVQNATAWVQETVFVLINARYNELLPTIVTSNLPPKALEERIGDRLVSRLVEMCLVIECKGRDQRLGPHEPPPIVRPSLPKPARDGTMTLDEAIAKGVKF